MEELYDIQEMNLSGRHISKCYILESPLTNRGFQIHLHTCYRWWLCNSDTTQMDLDNTIRFAEKCQLNFAASLELLCALYLQGSGAPNRKKKKTTKPAAGPLKIILDTWNIRQFKTSYLQKLGLQTHNATLDRKSLSGKNRSNYLCFTKGWIRHKDGKSDSRTSQAINMVTAFQITIQFRNE